MKVAIGDPWMPEGTQICYTGKGDVHSSLAYACIVTTALDLCA